MFKLIFRLYYKLQEIDYMKGFRRFPHYKQHDSSDCGPTSLRMIAKYYGIDYSDEMLRKHCHITRRGVNLLGISEAARYVGFDTAVSF